MDSANSGPDMRRKSRGPWTRWDHEWNYIYALWSGSECLYVGMTNDLDRRIASHRSSQPWWPEVDRITSDRVIGRGQAMECEAGDIRRYRPRYNIAHNPDAKAPRLGGITFEDHGIRHGSPE